MRTKDVTPNQSTRRRRSPALACLALAATTGCPSPNSGAAAPSSPETHEPDYDAWHESFHHQLDLRAPSWGFDFSPTWDVALWYTNRVPWSYLDVDDAPHWKWTWTDALQEMLFFTEEFDETYTDQLPAYVVFTHHGEARTRTGFVRVADSTVGRRLGRARVEPFPPSIFLDGRAVTEALIGTLPEAEGSMSPESRFLRIRPGVHHLEIHSEQNVVDLENDGKSYTRPLTPWVETLEIRAGDILLVETGLAPEWPGPTLTDDDGNPDVELESQFYRWALGATAVVLPRDGLMPDITRDMYPSAEEILEESRRRAELDDPAALFDLGLRHLMAIGLPQDTEDGVRFIERAAELEHPAAMETMGDIAVLRTRDSSDLGPEAPIFESFDWYQRALDAGRQTAGTKLIWLHERRLEEE